jgi:hypothetical protein
VKTILTLLLIGIFAWLLLEWLRSKGELRQLKQQKFGAFEITRIDSCGHSHLAFDGKRKKIAFLGVDIPHSLSGEVEGSTRVSFVLDYDDIETISLSFFEGIATATFHYQGKTRNVPLGVVKYLGNRGILPKLIRAEFPEDRIKTFEKTKTEPK